jgi:hypothetical protein
MTGFLVKGARLTTWAASPDGERIELGIETDSGQPCTISLPIGLLSALMMTIPRMLREALRLQLGDRSLRMTHELGTWRVERAVGAEATILSLITTDDFEVTFALPLPEADRLGATLRYSAEREAVSPPMVN